MMFLVFPGKSRVYLWFYRNINDDHQMVIVHQNMNDPIMEATTVITWFIKH